MHSVMTHQFNRIPSVKVERSVFDLSHGHKTTFDAGYLIPILAMEAMPGDSFNVKMNIFARLSTPAKALMDNLFLDSFFFAVPYRLLWSHWKNFMGEKSSTTDSTIYTCPYVVTPGSGITEGSLADYFGLPTKILHAFNANAFHFRAYNLIWNEWFRSTQLQNKVAENTGDGPDNYTDYALLRRGKRHDYFTSCLPAPQQGEAITIPLGSYANVVTNSNTPKVTAGDASNKKLQVRDASNSSPGFLMTESGFPTGSTQHDLIFGSETGLRADLSNATSATINSLRQAFQLQRMLERDMRGGNRYVEIIRNYYGVISPDFRQQRPELLSTGESRINIHPVPIAAQTISTVEQDAVKYPGELGAFATVSGQHGFVKSFTEHCVILGLVSLRADLNYSQGLDRMWTRQTRYDYYWPTLAHLGEMAVLNKELFFTGTADPDEGVFGYQERFAEYRYAKSKITGTYRHNATASLDVWHLAQEFGSLPTLGATFIQDDPPLDRVLVVPSEPHVLFDSYFQIKAARPMPVYSVPGMIDHL